MASFFKKPVVLVLTAIIVIVAVYLIVAGTRGKDIDFVIAERINLVQEVNVTGRVKPADSVELAFEVSGRVSRVSADVGDNVFAGQVLVQLSNGNLRAQLEEAEATLLSEQAKLDELLVGTRPEELEIQQAKVNDARQVLVNALRDAYIDSDDAVRNKVDQFINNAQSANPTLSIGVVNTSLKTTVEQGRVALESTLDLWKNLIDGLSVNSDLDEQISASKANLEIVRLFLDNVALAVNSATASGAITQATLDGYKSDVATARANVNDALSTVANEELDLKIEERELELDVSGATPEAIRSQEAKVQNAQASINKFKSQIEDTIIRSPINGVVTKQEAKVGEIAAANKVMASVISAGKFEIEVNVPEADVAKIKVGDAASVTLDAYGNDVIFETFVAAIDPAETIIEGVSTYKTTLQFAQDDERIRSGMTANIDIITATKENVVAVPRRAVISRNGEKFVRVALNGKIEEVEVEVGFVDREGLIEIISGVNEGDKVVNFIRE